MEGTERKVEIELESLESQESVFLLYEDPRSGNNRRALLQKEIQGRNSKSRNCGWLILLVPLVSLFVLTALVMDEDDLFSSDSTNQTQVTNETTFTATQPQSGPTIQTESPPPKTDLSENPPPNFPFSPPPAYISPSSLPQPFLSFVSDSAPSQSLQPVEGNNSEGGMSPVITEERIELIQQHGCTDHVQLVGDVRVDASRNLVVLYATKPETNRTVLAMKPQSLIWSNNLLENITEIVIKSIDGTADLDAWKVPSDLPPEDPLWKQLQETNITVNEGEKPSEFPGNLGESKEWSEESWNILRSQRLPESETQLTFFEKIRETIGKKLVSQGGELKMFLNRSWVAFPKGDLVSFEDAQKDNKGPKLKCDVTHKVPGIIFSGSGFLGNVFHDYDDDLRLFWFAKYELLLRQLSSYPIVLLGREKNNHCFLELKSSLDYHDILSIQSDTLAKQKTPGSIADFQSIMAKAWGSVEEISPKCQPVITLIQRTGCRMITNIEELRRVAEDLGFWVDIFTPSLDTPMPEVWRRTRSADVMIGVHGAAMTNLLYLKEESTLVQIVPIGLTFYARIYYGDPAEKMGLTYVKYVVQYEESSLQYKYSKDDPIVLDYNVVLQHGWVKFKETYLDSQNVTLDLGKFEDLLKDLKENIKSRPSFIKRMEKCEKMG